MLVCSGVYLVEQLETQEISTSFLKSLDVSSSTQKMKTSIGKIFDDNSNLIECAGDVILLRVFDVYSKTEDNKCNINIRYNRLFLFQST